MATLRNKRKLAAVSRETPEGSRGSRGRNVLDHELTHDYISQVSEEIERRVTKKLSKKFNKTESRILGALSKLDEFLLNPQVRTCSVAAHGTSRNANSENRETHGDRSSNDPYPEVGYFPHHSGQLNSPEAETNSQMVTENYPHIVLPTFHSRYPIWTKLLNSSSTHNYYIITHVHCGTLVLRLNECNDRRDYFQVGAIALSRLAFAFENSKKLFSQILKILFFVSKTSQKLLPVYAYLFFNLECLE